MALYTYSLSAPVSGGEEIYGCDKYGNSLTFTASDTIKVYRDGDNHPDQALPSSDYTVDTDHQIIKNVGITSSTDRVIVEVEVT